MSSTVLEVARPAHEDVERPIVRELQREPVNNRDSLFRSHRVCHMIHLITSTTDALIGVHEEDKDNARRDDIAALGGQTASGTINLFSAFYDRHKELGVLRIPRTWKESCGFTEDSCFFPL
ncbi:splicing factor 3A subunit [Musa troglodytarum]|uniref:Splicing factor 3A subunit n=1 Tax=Musa troglodytarum TaxID=320322 RepID=A0A9E7FP51_9LILI|nr:splicing factor 3A subunit [Musa troglodytarum]